MPSILAMMMSRNRLLRPGFLIFTRFEARCARRLDWFPDSGLMHFAAASPGGVLGFFAETDVSPSPIHWAPRGEQADFLEAEKSVSDLPDELVLERLGRRLG